MKKICLITTGHIASNPRLIKEAETLSKSGYKVHIIFVQNLVFLKNHDQLILKNNPLWTFDILDNTDQKFSKKVTRLTRTLIHKISLKSLKNNLALANNNFAINRNYLCQLNCAIAVKADLYIAHNLGALPVAIVASKKNKAKFGFDAEDFHRQEVNDDYNSREYRLAKFIEDRYLPQLDYLTTASPLITKKYKELYPKLNPTTINNVFSTKYLQKNAASILTKELKLFWFSQTIGKGRGIEDVIKAIGLLNNENITLTLLGHIDEGQKNYFLNLIKDFNLKSKQLIILPPVPADSIFEIANQHDIGLALEPGFCLNNTIALSNKIFSYLTSGLAVITSETSAQKEFMQQNSDIGQSYPIGDSVLLSNIINQYYINRDVLIQTKNMALKLAKTKYNWEIESIEFLKKINKILLD